MLAQRVDPPPDRGYMLTELQVEALDKTRVDLPTTLGQDRLDDLCRAEYDPVFHPDNAPAPIALHHLRIEQPGLRHPTRLGPGSVGLAALGLNPLPVMRHERG